MMQWGGETDNPKTDLADEVGIIDKTARSFLQGGLVDPKQHAGEDYEGIWCCAYRGEFGTLAEEDG